MSYRTDNPERDASDFIRYLDSLPDEPVPTEECDVCLNRSEDFRQAPDKGGFCCVDCLSNGKAIRFYLEHETEEKVNTWFEGLKIK